MKYVVVIVFLIIGGGCFATIAWFTFIDPKMSVDVFSNLVYAGMLLIVFCVAAYVWHQRNKRLSHKQGESDGPN